MVNTVWTAVRAQTPARLATWLLGLLIVPGVLLYLLLGREARTPFQLLAALICGLAGLLLLRGRLAGQALPTLRPERFYLLAIGLDAFIVANVRNALPAGSPEQWVWYAVAVVLAALYAAGFLIERRRG